MSYEALNVLSTEKLTQTILLDLGFGFTKAKCGDKYFHVPSVVGTPRELLEEQLKMTDIIYNNEFFIGDLAIRQSHSLLYSMNENKAQSEVAEILMKAAIGAVGEQSKKINIVTGLPFSMHSTQKEEMEKLIKNINNQNVSTYIVNEGNNALTIEIENYKVIPQGFSVAMNYLLDENGKLTRKDEAKKQLLVVDIGFYTLDFVILEGMEIHRFSHSRSDLGVSSLYQEIMLHLKGKRPQIHKLDKDIRNRQFDGMDITKLVEKAFDVYAKQIETEIKGFNMNFSNILISGGIAPEIVKRINYHNLYLSESSSFDNLHGYEKIAKRLWG